MNFSHLFIMLLLLHSIRQLYYCSLEMSSMLYNHIIYIIFGMIATTCEKVLYDLINKKSFLKIY